MRSIWYSLVLLPALYNASALAGTLNLSQSPLFLTNAVSPLTMLIIGRDHKLYFEAYNDASDIDGDGAVEIRFKPAIDYYGYFDSYKCYSYDSVNQYFYPVSTTATKKCSGTWSGNFLNYTTTARLDALRKVLYGGYRNVDTAGQTILQRTYVPQDGHSWGKEYQSLAIDGYNISEYTPFIQPLLTTQHLFANTTLRNGSSNPLLRVALNQPYRIWEWISIELPVAGSRALNGGSGPLILGIMDYVVRVKVCDSNIGIESNCTRYPNGSYKPTGLLQQFGENNSMLFGLITGSYVNNLAGGVLRKNISSFTNEVDLNTGIFSAFNGIVSTLNKLTVTGFDTNYNYSCGWITTRNIVNGECEMWGNPIAEMMYEAVRYFAGKQAPTAAYDYASGTDVTLGLPKPAWQDPYAQYPYCSKANMLVISDAPSYDDNYLPGSYFNTFSGDLTPTMNVAQLAQTIFTGEGFSSLLAFIGQSGTDNDGAPTPKTVTSFGNIRGLPLEPNSEGSYYSAAVAYYAWMNDLNPAKGTQNVKTYVVALSSPYPDFSFKVGNKTISLVPFAKSVNGLSINPAKGQYQPTNRIVDFYIESLTATSAVIRINFDDVQQGADFDMDAIVKYTITVNANNTLTVTLDSNYAAGSIVQHLGYVISGTTQDGLYLDVRDLDTGVANDIDYFLDTPPGQTPGTAIWQDHVALPLTSTRVFYPGSTPSATTFKSPLWYAAKWGGFTDVNKTGKPDTQDTFDADLDGVPDNYFNVTNANNLGPLLTKAFQQIIDRSGSFSSTALSSGYLNTDTIIYQAIFLTKDWSGQFLSFALDPDNGDIITGGSGPNGSLWDAGTIVSGQNYSAGRQILTYKPSKKKGIPFRWPANTASPTTQELDPVQITGLNTNPASGLTDTNGQIRLQYLRGNRSLEAKNGGTLRNRSSVLGDIINSNPVAVGKPNSQYPLAWPDNADENNVPYSAFKTSNTGRQSVVYVGSNDGMLHGFNGSTGSEIFAYVPSPVYANLSALTNPDYTHHYYVDGPPNVMDAFYSNTWHTVLVGGLGAGGQGIYALDITNPGLLTEGNAGTVVLWEFTDADDSDLGFTFGQPAIVRLNNGKWAAIFSNGYNNTAMDGIASTTGNAVVYIVDISNGSLIKKFDSGVGMINDPLGTGRPNGMSAPTVIDTNGDGVADTIYAGDLFGNLWKIDISAANANSWDFAIKQGNQPLPFFVAKDANGNRQPITAQPAVLQLNYSDPSFQIFVGTGKYIENNDKSDLSVQSIYALTDDGVNTVSGRSVLQAQSILSEQNNVRITTDTSLPTNAQGWYMDLTVNSQARGERIISNISILNGKIIFSTIIPTNNPCDFGGESWLMELDAVDGSRLSYNVFDINNDGKFDNADAASYTNNGQTITVAVSGLKSEVGLVAMPSILSAGTKEYKYMSGTSGGIQKVTENPGAQIYDRQSWRELR